MIGPDGLRDALPRADIVILATPLTDETHHMVNKDFLGKMRLKSILVNVGRGGLVDEAALVESLEYGKPGFAVLDVFEEEPLPVISPLWSHPDVTISPHASAFTPLTTQRGDDVFIDNLERYIKGDLMRFVVKDF